MGANCVNNAQSVVDLGITVDCNLKFSLHIQNIAKKAFSRSYLIFKCFQSRDVPTLMRAYKTFVLPLMEYNCPVWSPHLLKDINLLESVQHRFTKRLPGMHNLCYNDRLSALNIDRLEARRLRIDIITAYKIIFGLTVINCNDLFRFNDCTIATRGHRYKLLLPNCKCDNLKFYFASRVVRVWNKLPIATDFSSLAAFKKSVDCFNFDTLCIGR